MTQTTESNQPVTAPDGWRAIFRALVLILVAGFSFVTAHGLLIIAQHLRAQVPAGVIQKVGPSKSGWELHLTSGAVADFPSDVLYEQRPPITLKPGDAVAKQRWSLTYLLNGSPITSAAWMIRHWLLSDGRLIVLAIFLLLHTLFVMIYRKTPWADWGESRRQRPDREPKPVKPAKPRSLAYRLVVSPVKLWVAMTITMAIVLQFEMCCVFAVFWPLVKHG